MPASVLVVGRRGPCHRDVGGAGRGERRITRQQVARPAVGASLEEEWLPLLAHPAYRLDGNVVKRDGVEGLSCLGLDLEGSDDVRELAGAQVRAPGFERLTDVVLANVEHWQLPHGGEVERLVD